MEHLTHTHKKEAGKLYLNFQTLGVLYTFLSGSESRRCLQGLGGQAGEERLENWTYGTKRQGNDI